MGIFRYPVPSQPPASGVQHTCTFGVEWLAVILDRIDDLQRGGMFDSPPADIAQQIRELLDLLETDTTPTPQVFPDRVFITGQQRVVLHGNPLLIVAVTQSFFGFHVYQNTPAINDETEWKFLLKAGTYNLVQIITRSSAAGIVGYRLDGGGVTYIDMYTASTTYNSQIYSTIVIPTDGEHILNMKVEGKNASSSGYYYSVAAMWFAPQ